MAGIFVVVHSGSAAARDETCVARWSDAAPIVEANKLATIEALSAKASRKLGGSIVKATLCAASNGGFTYDLVVRTAKGKLKSVTVDARNPF